MSPPDFFSLYDPAQQQPSVPPPEEEPKVFAKPKEQERGISIGSDFKTDLGKVLHGYEKEYYPHTLSLKSILFYWFRVIAYHPWQFPDGSCVAPFPFTPKSPEDVAWLFLDAFPEAVMGAKILPDDTNVPIPRDSHAVGHFLKRYYAWERRTWLPAIREGRKRDEVSYGPNDAYDALVGAVSTGRHPQTITWLANDHRFVSLGDDETVNGMLAIATDTHSLDQAVEHVLPYADLGMQGYVRTQINRFKRLNERRALYELHLAMWNDYTDMDSNINRIAWGMAKAAPALRGIAPLPDEIQFFLAANSEVRRNIALGRIFDRKSNLDLFPWQRWGREYLIDAPRYMRREVARIAGKANRDRLRTGFQDDTELTGGMSLEDLVHLGHDGTIGLAGSCLNREVDPRQAVDLGQRMRDLDGRCRDHFNHRGEPYARKCRALVWKLQNRATWPETAEKWRVGQSTLQTDELEETVVGWLRKELGEDFPSLVPDRAPDRATRGAYKVLPSKREADERAKEEIRAGYRKPAPPKIKQRAYPVDSGRFLGR